MPPDPMLDPDSADSFILDEPNPFSLDDLTPEESDQLDQDARLYGFGENFNAAYGIFTGRSLMKIACLVLALIAFTAPAVAQDGLGEGWRLLTQTTGDWTKLLVLLSASDGASVIDLYTTRHDPAACRIGSLAAGHYKTACGKGYFDCSQGEPPVIDPASPLLSFEDEAVKVVFLFEKIGVRKIWSSD